MSDMVRCTCLIYGDNGWGNTEKVQIEKSILDVANIRRKYQIFHISFPPHIQNIQRQPEYTGRNFQNGYALL